MGKKKGKSKAQDEGSSEGEGEVVSGVLEEKLKEGEEVVGSTNAQKQPGGGKKGKKDRKKKGTDDDDWEDDLAEIAAESCLSVDTGGGGGEDGIGHSGSSGKKKKMADVGSEDCVEEQSQPKVEPELKPMAAESSVGGANKTGGKKKRKKKQDMDWEDDIEMLAREIEGGNGSGMVPGQTEKPTSQTSDSPTLEPHEDHPVTTTKETGMEPSDGTASGETKALKTKAEKKAAKKERDKKKKEVGKQKTQPTDKTTDQTTTTEASEEKVVEEETEVKQKGAEQPHTISTEEGKSKDEMKEEDSAVVSSEPVKVLTDAGGGTEIMEDEEGEGEGETDEKKKKKKKKKKPAEEEKKSKTKKPAKSAILKMKEQIEFMRAEQKRREEEERARQLAEEEAQRREEEAARLEQERKEKKKQKEKERRDRRKKEGKPVTKAEKEKYAKAQAMLQVMKDQGFQIPERATDSGGEGRPGGKRVRYASRPRMKKTAPKEEEVSTTEDILEELQEEASTMEVAEETVHEEETDKQEEEVKMSWEEIADEENVKKRWDAEEGDEQEETSKKQPVKPDSQVLPPGKDGPTEKGEGGEGEEEEEEEEGSSDDESSESEEELTTYEKAERRIAARRKRHYEEMSLDYLRSPVVCVLGHVDTGKTKILDKIRHTNVQDGEAGGITQQIGATFVPEDAIRAQTKMIKDFAKTDIKLPGLLIIDTPGHESFSNLRSRGSSMCDLAILVVDIMHGLEPQTLESLGMLKKGNTPFIVVINKIDRLFDWRRMPTSSVKEAVKKQKVNTKDEFDERVRGLVTEFAEQGLNVALFWEKVDFTDYIPLVPTSAHTGDGMGDLISLLVTYSQKVLAPKLMLSQELEAIVLEVKVIAGLGTTIDVILRNGILKEGDTLILTGTEGPFTAQVRALLMPQPLRELRVKNAYVNHKAIIASQGVKITAKDLEKTRAGTPIFVAKKPDEVEVLKDEASKVVTSMLTDIQLQERGVYVQASTLGSLEALLAFLKQSKIPYCGVNIGPVHKRDIMKASVMLEHDSQWAVILAFDVRVEREAQELADNLGVKVFTAEIIYHLFDNFLKHRKELRDQKRREYESIAIFPCKLRILPNCVFNTRDPIVVGVVVEAGLVKRGTVLTIPSKSFIDIGIISSLEVNHKQVDIAHKGEEVCIKIEPMGGDAPKLYGRHFDHTDLLISKVSRESIDAVKNYFREDLQKSDWQLFIELKKLFQII